MRLSVGEKLGPYEIAGALDSGGMGDVYRARDTRLARDVAVKVLPEAMARDEERQRRFELEARAASTLSHPNILAIYDVGRHEESPYLVSELLEGETLRARLDEGPLSPPRALDYASQVARGLAAAHERGVVHRDLKPANLFVTRDGVVKILDFGLAKLTHEGADGESDGDDGGGRPTVTRGTTPGSVLGTVGYMSPEQVRGRPADHRSDIFAFGAVLYEMLSGRRAFRGDSAVETMSAILKEEPPEITSAGRTVPPALARIASHCLEKRPEDRFQSARDLVFDLESVAGSTTVGSGAGTVLAPPRAARRPLVRAAWAALAATVLAAAFLAGRGSGERPAQSYRQVTYSRGVVSSARFTPDAGTFVYSAKWGESPEEVFTGRLDTPDARAMGMEGATLVAVARNGEMAVLHGPERGIRTLARVPLTGGAYRDIVTGVAAADWRSDGTDFAVTRVVNGFRLEYPIGHVLVETAGGLSHPRISPDGRRVAFIEHPLLADDRGAIAVVDRDGHREVLSDGWASAEGLAWSPDGSEVWFTATRQGALCGLHAVDLSGNVRTITTAPGRLVLQDIAPDGRVLLNLDLKRAEAYGRASGATEERSLSWHDYTYAVDLSKDGRTLLISESGEAGGPGYGVYLRPMDGSPAVRLGEGRPFALSPDGRWALTMPLDPPERLVLLPTGAGTPRTLPLAPLVNGQFAAWFPDGRRLVVVASEPTATAGEGAERPSGGLRLFVRDLDDEAPPRPITPEGVAMMGDLVTPDGKAVLGFALGETPPKASLYPVDGGEARRVAFLEPEDNVLGWNADGTALYVSRGKPAPRRILRLDLATGRRTTLHDIRPTDPAGVVELGRILVSADGGTYVYNLHRTLSTLFVVEGLR